MRRNLSSHLLAVCARDRTRLSRRGEIRPDIPASALSVPALRRVARLLARAYFGS